MALLGCGGPALPAPAPPYDAVVVPGCPSEADGAPSRCQLSRSGYAFELWRRGVARAFIVSGGAVHSPYVEAEAIAQQMALLGVPPERIVLETEALHTDENAWFSMHLAHAMGFASIAAASNGAHGKFVCAMMRGWGQPCAGLSVDVDALPAILGPREAELLALRARRVVPWWTLEDTEERLARETGRSRWPSFVLYPAIAMGMRWTPRAPRVTTPRTYAELVGAAPERR